MGISGIVKSTAKFAAGFNAATVVRAARFGVGDASKRLMAGFDAIDPMGVVTAPGGRIRLGGHELVVPPGNPLYSVYTRDPGFNSDVGRLAGVVSRKYPGATIVDVGANIGDTAAIIRGRCSSPIVCIEGDPALTATLTANAGSMPGVTVIAAYLGDEPGSCLMSVDKGGWNSTLVPLASGPGVTVNFSTLDQLLGGDRSGAIKFVKIDVEGYERKILAGASRILREHRPVVQFEHNRHALAGIGGGEDGPGVFRFLAEAGYRRAMFWDDSGRFLLGTSLGDEDMIRDIHDYVAFSVHPLSRIYYLDACVFHEDDEDLYIDCVAEERAYRGPNGLPQ
jgi:FkbM family methyltransferase